MNSKQSGRRKFLKSGAALVGLAAGGMGIAKSEEAIQPETIRPTGLRPIGEISHFEKLTRSGTATQGYTPLTELQGIITPSNLHFYVNHEKGVLMNIDPQQHRLTLYGEVDRPLVLTMAEVKRLPSVSRVHFLECNANSNPKTVASAKNVVQGHGLTSCSEWTGVLLSVMLKEVGVKKGANWLLVGSADPSKHASSIPLEKAMDDALVAYAQNGEALRLEQGYPLRLILPGWGGRLHIKWLNRVKVVDQPYMTTQDRTSQMDHDPAGEGAFMIAGEKARAWRFQAFPKSIITFPSGGQQLQGRGFYEITGLAWSGGGSVRKVEVSTDSGRTWKDAQLQEPVLRKAHTRFRFPWKWNGEEAVIQSRCTDDQGDTQPSATELSKNWGTDTSKACTSVMGEDCKKIPRRADRAYIQSWRVTPDGSVLNAFVVTPEMLQIEEGPIHGSDRPDRESRMSDGEDH